MTKDDYLACGRREDGSLLWRTWLLHWIAALVGIQFKIGGWPYGASHTRSLNGQAWDRAPKCSAEGHGG